MEPFDLDPDRTGRVVIADEHVALRPICPDDVGAIHAYRGRPDVARWLLEHAWHETETQEAMRWMVDAARIDSDGQTVLLAIERDGELVGDLDATVTDLHGGCVEIGWRLHPDHQRRGLATAAARLLLSLLFESLGARRVVASLDPRNRASAALCQRIGMRHEAHHVQDLWWKGEWADTDVYAMLSSEWTAQR